MSNFKTVLAVGATALLLASCGATDDAVPATVSPTSNVSAEVGAEIGTEATEPAVETVTETVTEAAPEPAVETVTEEAAPAPAPAPEPEPAGVSDAEINALALEIVWGSLSTSEQSDVCWGLDMDEAMMLDAFMEGAGDSFSRSEAKSFFNKVC